MTTTSNKFATERAKIVSEFEKKLRDLDTMEAAYNTADALASAWTKDRPDRRATLWVWAGGLHLGFGLGKGEAFGDAEEAFCEAQERLAAALTHAQHRCDEWTAVKDESSQYQAARGSRTSIRPLDDEYGYVGGMSVHVYARPEDGTACQLVQIGTKEQVTTVRQVLMVPEFKAVCPGDPIVVTGAF